ncbi:MAG: hypothetical protein WKF68_08620 [Daejeonella sp.]
MAIDELVAFFSSIQLPDTINLSQGVKIINVPDVIENHLKVLNIRGNIPEVSVFYERLIFIKEILLRQI